ncbi:hypothetical protein D3C80_2233600 [compost metagenome]
MVHPVAPMAPLRFGRIIAVYLVLLTERIDADDAVRPDDLHRHVAPERERLAS